MGSETEVTTMKVTKKNGNLIITVPIDETMPLSATGKTRRVFSSGGNQLTTVKIDNEHNDKDVAVIVGLNCYVRATDGEAMKQQVAYKMAEKAAKAEAKNV